MRRRADDPPPTNSLPIPSETSSPNPIHSTPSNPNPILRVFHSIISLIQYILSLTLIPLAGFLTNTAPTDGRSLSASQASQIEFQQTYNTSASLTSTSIPFDFSPYQAVASSAQENHRMLLIYLHPPEIISNSSSPNNNSPPKKFLQNILLAASPNSSNNEARITTSLIVPNNMIPYGVHATTAEGYRLAKLYNVKNFPFLGVVIFASASPSSSSSTTGASPLGPVGDVICSVSGYDTCNNIETICQFFGPTVAAYGVGMRRAASAKLQREADARLRIDQDREFREMQELDRKREAEKREKEEEEELNLLLESSRKEEEVSERASEPLMKTRIVYEPASEAKRSEAKRVRASHNYIKCTDEETSHY